MEPVAVIAIFEVAAFADEVAVSAVGHRFAKVAVFVVDPGEAELGSLVHEFVELFEKRTVRVVVAGGGSVIAFFGVPTGLAKDYVVGFLRKTGNKRVLAVVAGTGVVDVVVDVGVAS